MHEGAHDLRGAIQPLRAEVQPIGMEYALPECAVWSPDPHTGNHIATAVDLPRAPEGVAVAGSPIGSEAYTEPHFGEKLVVGPRPLPLQPPPLQLRYVPSATKLHAPSPLAPGLHRPTGPRSWSTARRHQSGI
jgi:hypothetical protein